MQGGAPATATLSILNEGVGGSVSWFKNGVNQGSVAVSITTTINAGDTFYVRAQDIDFGASIDYTLNGSYVTTYSGSRTAITPTFTAVGGNTYFFNCYPGF